MRVVARQQDKRERESGFRVSGRNPKIIRPTGRLVRD